MGGGETQSLNLWGFVDLIYQGGGEEVLGNLIQVWVSTILKKLLDQRGGKGSVDFSMNSGED